MFIKKLKKRPDLIKRDQFMFEKRYLTNVNRLNRFKIFLNVSWWLSSDENYFNQEKKWLYSDISRVMHTKFPSGITVLGFVENEGHVKSHIFSTRSLSKFCCLHEVMKPWINSLSIGRLYMFKPEEFFFIPQGSTNTRMYGCQSIHQSTPNIWPIKCCFYYFSSWKRVT